MQVLKQVNREQLKSWARKFFSSAGQDYQQFDIEAEIDNELTMEENKTILREKIKRFVNVWATENKQEQKIAIKEMPSQEAVEKFNFAENKKLEVQAQLEFIKSLDEVVKKKDSLLLEQKFFLLREYVKMVVRGNATGLIAEGEAGVGKSFNILKTLKESGRKFFYCSGYTTTLELYNFIYEHRHDIIFFDDIKSLFSNSPSLELLKAILFSPTGTRLVRYNSSTNRLQAPREFIFEGGVVVALNSLSQRQNEDLKAVLDRVLYFKVEFSYQEKMQILADLIKQDYKELNLEERQKIYSWLRENTSSATQNLNFRLLFKLFEVLRFCEKDFNKFSQMAKQLIDDNEEVKLIQHFLKESSTIKEAQLKWSEETGFSRRYFYNLKRTI